MNAYVISVKGKDGVLRLVGAPRPTLYYNKETAERIASEMVSGKVGVTKVKITVEKDDV